MVNLEVAINKREDLELISFDEILETKAPRSTRRAQQAERFRTPVIWHDYSGEEGIAPDRIFGIRAGDQDNYFFLEIDQGTETIEPSVRRQRPVSLFRQSSMLRKFVLYASVHQARVHQKYFGIPSFRVLTVTTTPTRAANMAEVCGRFINSGELQARPGLFLFFDQQTIADHVGDVLVAPFLNGVGNDRRGVV